MILIEFLAMGEEESEVVCTVEWPAVPRKGEYVTFSNVPYPNDYREPKDRTHMADECFKVDEVRYTQNENSPGEGFTVQVMLVPDMGAWPGFKVGQPGDDE